MMQQITHGSFSLIIDWQEFELITICKSDMFLSSPIYVTIDYQGFYDDAVANLHMHTEKQDKPGTRGLFAAFLHKHSLLIISNPANPFNAKCLMKFV